MMIIPLPLFSPFGPYNKGGIQLLIGSDILEIERNSLLSHNPERFIIPNLNYDGQRTTSEIEALQSQISYYLGMVVADQKIIDKGEIVNEEKDQIIQSYLAKVNEKTLSRRFSFPFMGRSISIRCPGNYPPLHLSQTLQKGDYRETCQAALPLWLGHSICSRSRSLC